MTAENVYQKTVDFIQKRISAKSLENVYDEYLVSGREKRAEEANRLIELFSPLIQSCKDSHSVLYYFFLSFLLQATNRLEVYHELIESTTEDEKISKENKFGIYAYISEVAFLGVVSGNTETSVLADRLYRKIYDAFQKEIPETFTYIAKEDRNQNLIFVLTTQVLGMGHGPTKTLLDRCEVLKQTLKKDVFIINTAEMKGSMDGIPLFRSSVGNYREEYQNRDFLMYHDVEYPFFQCPKGMPSVPVIQEILSVVSSEKPLCIVTIGGGSIVSDLCSRIVPTIVISTIPSGHVRTLGQFQAIGRKISKEDSAWAERNHLPKDHFIESIFTSAFKKQEHRYTRPDLNLPEQAFIAALVGGRLDAEIGEECLHMLLRLMEQGVFIAFIGGYQKFDELKKRNDLFAKYGINMGVQDDVLAVLECIDLYINPKRVGGGTSVAEALYKGVPVVTMGYGDGGLGAGENFYVKDYDEMYEKVLCYQSDQKFYSEMSFKAKERAEVLTNTEKEFLKVMNTAMSRDAFQ